jgi:hypothetical protein
MHETNQSEAVCFYEAALRVLDSLRDQRSRRRGISSTKLQGR